MTNIFKLLGIISVDGLDAAKRGLAQLDTQFKAADKALTKFGRQSQKIGGALTKGFTVPIAALGASIGLATTKTADYAEQLLNLKSLTGLSLTSLQEFKHVTNQLGVEFTPLINSIQQFTRKLPLLAKEGGPAYDAIKKLGVNIYDAQGSVRDINDLFPEFIKKLQGIENPLERTSAAQQIFGREVTSLAPILGLTSNELEKMQREAHDLGLIMSDEALAAADAYGDEVDKLKEQFTAFWMKLSADIIPILRDTIIPLIQSKIIPAFQTFAVYVKGLVDTFKALDPATKNIVLGVIGITAAIGPMLIVFGKTILLAFEMQKAFVLARVSFMALSATMLSNPFTIVIAGIGLLAAAFVSLKWDIAAAKKETDNFYKALGEKANFDTLHSQIAAIQDMMVKYGTDVNGSAESNELFGKSIEAAVKEAHKLGYAVEGSLSEKFRTLMQLADGNTEGIARWSQATQDAADNAERLAKATLTKDELAAASKANQENADKLAAITENKIENLDRLEKAEIANAAKGADINLITKRYALEREQITSDEAKNRTEKYAKEKKDSEDSAKEIAETKLSWDKKVLEQSGNQTAALELDRTAALAAVKGQKETELQINKFYDAEILKAKEEAKNKEKTLLGGTIKDWIGAFQTIGQGISEIFSMSTDNRIAEVDNWENAERQAIERSTDSERTKSKKIERLDQEAESKRMEIKKKAAKQSKAISLFESVIGTGAAVVGALGMKPWTPFNFILAGIVGALGVAKTAMIAAQPLPFAEGGVIKGGKGGVQGLVGEGSQDELIMPLKTGIASLADGIMARISGAFGQSPAFALAGAGGGNAGARSEVHWHVGTLVADDRGIKELERRQLQFRVSEQQRKGQS